MTLKTIEYIKTFGLDALKENLGINIKKYPDGVTVLSYDQIESPKAHEVVVECRGLILRVEENSDIEILCRTPDRFFNYGENGTEGKIDWSSCVLYEKIDGSLIKIWYDPRTDTWNCGTRSSAYGENTCSDGTTTFKELVYKALKCSTDEEFRLFCHRNFWIDASYFFELTCFENRCVVRYDGYSMWYLCSRINETGTYAEICHDEFHFDVLKFPKKFTFNTYEEVHSAVNSLPNLEEGYVAYIDGVPTVKVKSGAYVAAHRLRGEGLTPKRISAIVWLNEHEEYLSIFPDDRKYFEEVTTAREVIRVEVSELAKSVSDITDKKEFALAVKDTPYSGIMFSWFKDKSIDVDVILHKGKEDYLFSLIQKILDESKV